MSNIIKSLVLSAAVALGGAALAEDSYLYWLMGTGYDAWTDFSYVKVAMGSAPGASGTTYLTIGASTVTGGFSGDLTAGQYAGTNAEPTGKKFWVELYNSSGNCITVSGMSDYSAILAAANIGPDVFSITGDGHNFGATFVPEPTSGLLTLLGFGLLAIRRKRKLA